jgi:hypothetical protein
MTLPKGFVLPAWLNLGVAPPPPQAATAYAPRATMLTISALGDIFETWGGTEPLFLSTFYLAPVALDGPVVEPPRSAGLMPNPYSSQQW